MKKGTFVPAGNQNPVPDSKQIKPSDVVDFPHDIGMAAIAETRKGDGKDTEQFRVDL